MGNTLSLRRALKEARKIGLNVQKKHCTGEVTVTNPNTRAIVRLNARKKDCPRNLRVMLKRSVSKIRNG